MPRAPRAQPAKPETAPAPEQPKATAEEKGEEPKEQQRRPRQTQQSSREGMVEEGTVPQIELFVPDPIEAKDLEKLNVYQRWNAMIGEMGIIPKRGWNRHHQYWFTTDADLNAFVGPLLRKYHLIVVPRLIHGSIERFETAGKQYVTRVPMLVSIVNADKPDEVIEIPWAGEGGDTVDKGLYKAYTGGLKYFYMKTLQVATGDDPEIFTRSDQIGEMAATAAASEGQRPQRQPDVRPSNRPQPQKGGRQDEVTEVQIRQVKAMTKVLDGIRGTAAMIDSVLDTKIYDTVDGMDDKEEAWAVIVNFLKGRTGQDVGKLLHAMGEEQAKRVAAKEAEAQSEPEAAEAQPEPDNAETADNTAPPGFVPDEAEMGGGHPG